jgi:hypothetical protein
MADPLSLIALGAGIGGVAGKVAEKAWDTGERWLAAKFGEHSEVARLRARENAAAFMLDLAERLRSLETNGRLDGGRAAAEQQHPQFSTTLQGALLRAAQTENREKHQLLAELIAQRLVSESESLITLASQMAVDAIALATPRQLRLLALCSFLEEVRPRDPVDDHCLWLDVCLRPFEDLWFYKIDAMHLAALSCVLFDQTSQKGLDVSLGFKFLRFEDGMFAKSAGYEWLTSLWTEGLAGVQLTSVGSLVGALAYDRLTGAHTGIPKWYGG